MKKRFPNWGNAFRTLIHLPIDQKHVPLAAKIDRDQQIFPMTKKVLPEAKTSSTRTRRLQGNDHERKQLKRALDRLREYRTVGRQSEIYRAAEAHNIDLTPPTIRAYLDDETLEASLRRTKMREIIEIASVLPGIQDAPGVAYQFLMSEMGLTRGDVSNLSPYRGTYVMHHRMGTIFTVTCSP